ncbi:MULTISPECIES: long-chain fatty acid--CoA ligase [unclassified Amycolatopsis]|uniref:acyl-CoA synthetase n=1 Tax=unclassified Amycolatopsis TaxID=2618356 RepID=UPI0028755236|nr:MULTISPECIES: long-chain fatty acid--CoA ligase [unclassified Amycolatopsis]MDS0138706.1 long-chain fatty acid--CoA ligase [Amycolatopsis sp. 505]MDS0147200.1 long-chain fatty acid--CoA ligase [Amycolatopsis sp. CM201R]
MNRPDFGLGSWPARRARINPDRTALVEAGRSLTYAGLAERVHRLSGALIRRGVRPGDRVAYLGVNAITVFETLFATARCGAIFVPLNYRLAPAEIRYMLDDSGASVLVHSPDTASLVAAAGGLPDGAVIATEGDFEAEIAEAGPAPDTEVRLEDPCLLLYTSGTTGRPKAAVLTHGNLTWNTVNQLAHLDVLGTDKALCIAPLFHCVGLGQITLPTLFKGGSVEPVARFDPGTILARIGEAGITSFSAVPTMLEMMCRHEDWDRTDLSSLTCVLYGGSPVAERVARAWLDRGVKLLQGYGMTEAAPGVSMATHEGTLDHPVAAGVPHFFTDVAALGPDLTPQPLDGNPAELLVRGPHVFGGYWHRPEESKASFVEGGWFRTGDVVRVDDDGWAHVVDRVKDMIISGGENVYPAEIEAVAVRLDAVDACAVVGVPDERWGEAGAAFVVLRPGAELDEPRFRAHLEQHLARYKVPKHVQFTDTLPRNATGKIRRVELRTLAAETFTNGTA